MRAVGRELTYAVAMPFLILLSVADQRWPQAVGRWDDFWTEVDRVRRQRPS